MGIACCLCFKVQYKNLHEMKHTKRGDFLCNKCAGEYTDKVWKIEMRKVRWKK